MVASSVADSFDYNYLQAYTEMIAERRRNQKNGTEDTYGLRIRKE